MTGTSEGKNLLIKCPEILKGVVDLSLDDAEVIAKDAILVLINVASVEYGAEILLKTAPNNEKVCLNQTLTERSLIPIIFNRKLV